MEKQMSKTGKIVSKNGRPHWVADTSCTAPPTSENKMIPLRMLGEEAITLLSDSYKFLSIPKYYERKEFIDNYQKFHSLTGNKYLSGGFEKFKVACYMARRTYLR